MPGLSSATLSGERAPADAAPLSYTPERSGPPPAIDWAKVAADLAPIACEQTIAARRRKSRDYYWFSPVLAPQLDGVIGDLVVTPKDEDELLRLARYCVAQGVPLTARGAGTGNYGQSMPLHGGIIVSMTELGGIKWVRDGVLRVGAGMSLLQIEREIRPLGQELRFFPSTWKTATVGGFVAGGSSGIGAMNYGTLSSPGNVLGVRLLTLEDEPRFIELRGADVLKVVHAYGTNGLITEIEMALAPLQPWTEFVLSAPSIMEAVRFADGVARADGVVKKELAAIDWAGAQHFDDFRPYLIPDRPAVMAIIGTASRETFIELAEAAGLQVVFERGPGAPQLEPAPVYEFCWNHTTLQVLKHDRGVTYLQLLFDGADRIEKIAQMIATFGDEVPAHIEFARVDGEVKCFGLQLVRYTSEARLNEIIEHHWTHGCPVFNPHTVILETGGRAAPDPQQFEFKREADPHGLLNPGKMPGWGVPAAGYFTTVGAA